MLLRLRVLLVVFLPFSGMTILLAVALLLMRRRVRRARDRRKALCGRYRGGTEIGGWRRLVVVVRVRRGRGRMRRWEGRRR